MGQTAFGSFAIYWAIGILWIGAGLLLPPPFRWMEATPEPSQRDKAVLVLFLSLLWPLVFAAAVASLAKGEHDFDPMRFLR